MGVQRVRVEPGGAVGDAGVADSDVGSGLKEVAARRMPGGSAFT